MSGRQFLVVVGLISNAYGAEQVITVMDDHTTPVPSIVFADNSRRLGPTDENGVLSVTEEQCGGGAPVTGEPITRREDYIIPSSTGYCIGQPVEVVLTRRVVLTSARRWATQAIDSGNWGVAAHALNEQYALIRVSSPEEAEQVKHDVLEASARVVGVDPATAVEFDSAQDTFVMNESFGEALLVWKADRRIGDPTAVLDYEFFREASKRRSADILYHSPE